VLVRDAIRKILVDRIDVQKQSVGIVVGVIEPSGRRVVAYGKLAKDDPRPLNGDTLYEIGSITKQWSTYSLDLVFARIDNFQSTEKGDAIVIRKLPELQFSSRDRQISEKVLPIWVSLDSSAGLLRRTQPLFQTRQFTERADFQPRVMTALYWKGFHLIPSFSVRGTHYGERQEDGRILGAERVEAVNEAQLFPAVDDLTRRGPAVCARPPCQPAGGDGRDKVVAAASGGGFTPLTPR
jgi:hypothetical protein